jgi:hypothetical protein
MNDHTEAERLALITREQIRLVNSETHLLEVGFEDQDDPNAHHGHSRRRQRHSAEIISFPKNGRAHSEVVNQLDAKFERATDARDALRDELRGHRPGNRVLRTLYGGRLPRP